jgi:hypothetical protein
MGWPSWMQLHTVPPLGTLAAPVEVEDTKGHWGWAWPWASAWPWALALPLVFAVPALGLCLANARPGIGPGFGLLTLAHSLWRR